MIRKATTQDLAAHAGVSLATVDRVLNARPGVRRTTIDKVQRAIDQLGYVRDRQAANLARGRVYRLLFLLPDTDTAFLNEVRRQVEHYRAALVGERTLITVRGVPAFDGQALTETLHRIGPTGSDTTGADNPLGIGDKSSPEGLVDGVAVFGPETAAVRDAINRLRARGLPVVTLVADIPSSRRNYFVGIDNVAAGRTAAALMGRLMGAGTHGELMCAGAHGERRTDILVIAGSSLVRDHIERRNGFDQVMQESFPHLNVLPTVFCQDDPRRIEARVGDLLRTRPRIGGLYAAAAGNSGLLRAVSGHAVSGHAVSRHVVSRYAVSGHAVSRHPRYAIIAHELTAATRAGLKADLFDAIICQNEGHLVRSAVRVLRALSDGEPFDAARERIGIDIYCKENLPPERASERSVNST